MCCCFVVAAGVSVALLLSLVLLLCCCFVVAAGVSVALLL